MLIPCVALVIFLLSPQASAQEQGCDTQCWADRGVALYEVADYEGALRAFQQGYMLSQEPLFLLNVSVCHHKVGQVELALETAERLAASPGTLSAELRQDNDARVIALRATIRAGQVAADMKSAPPQTIERVEAVEEKASGRERRARLSRPLAFSSLIAGGATYGLTAWLRSRYSEEWDDLERAAAQGDQERYDALILSIEPQRRRARIAFVGASALTLVGAMLLIYNQLHGSTSASTLSTRARRTWHVSAGWSRQGALLSGRFSF